MALGPFVAFAAGAAVVYKWTDPAGVVHYSDQAVPGAEKIVTSSGAANGIGGTPAPVVRSTAAPANRASTGLDYSRLAIGSPAPEQVFFGDEVIPVRLELEPGLRPSHAITWLLNGKALTEQGPAAQSFALQTLPRGSYTLTATVTDAASGQSKSTGTVTFYVRQPSLLSPQHKGA